MHLNTSRDPRDPILYKDLESRGLNLQGALQAIKVPKSLSTVDITLRFDVHRDLVWKYHQDRYLIHLGEGKNPTAVTEKALSNVRGFQKFMNRVFEPSQDNISLNSREAVYLLGGGIALRTPHDKFYRFEWTLPTQRGERLLEKILTQEWSKNGEIFVIKVSDLENGNLYQIQTSREQLAAHPEMNGPETWSVLHRGPRGRPPYMYTKGMSLRTKMSILANLDVSGYPCDNGRNPIQSFAWNSFHNDGLVLFHGPEAALVRFWGGGNTNEIKSKELQLKPITAATWATPPTATAFEIRVPSHERTLHAQVVAGLFGPYKIWRRAADPTFAGNVYRAGYTNENLAFLAHNFNMLDTVIVCAYPNDIKKNALLKAEDQTLTVQNQAVMAGTKLGSTAFVAAIIEEDERLASAPISASEKIGLLDNTASTDPPPLKLLEVTRSENKSHRPLEGLLVQGDAITLDQETGHLDFVASIQNWDTTTRRKLRHFGFSHDAGGKNVQPSDPIPENIVPIMGQCQQFLRDNGIDEVLNQCSIADYPPSVGIKDHVENFLLGKVVVIVNLLATVPMQFSPSDDGGGERATILLERWSIVALTGKCRYKYKHGICSSEHDIIAGEKVARPRRVSMIFRSVPDLTSNDKK